MPLYCTPTRVRSLHGAQPIDKHNLGYIRLAKKASSTTLRSSLSSSSRSHVVSLYRVSFLFLPEQHPPPHKHRNMTDVSLITALSVLPPPPRYPTQAAYNAAVGAGHIPPMIETNNILSNPEDHFLVGEGELTPAPVLALCEISSATPRLNQCDVTQAPMSLRKIYTLQLLLHIRQRPL